MARTFLKNGIITYIRNLINGMFAELYGAVIDGTGDIVAKSITVTGNDAVTLENTVYDDLQVSISNIRVPASNAPTERLYDHGISGGLTFPVLGFAVGMIGKQILG